MSLYDNLLYLEDVNKVIDLPLPWEKLCHKTIVVSGASGLLGSFFIDVLMKKQLDCTIYALGRSEKKFKERFEKWRGDRHLQFIICDVCNPIIDSFGKVDYVMHLASNTHPRQYSLDPIGTIATNILGLKNMLDLAVESKASLFVFSSSNEIYGENRGDIELFDEQYCGYIDPNTLRAGYPESKRCGEALCRAYYEQKGLDYVIPRFTRSYGPTMHLNDSKAISQFIINGLNNEDIVLKSDGSQFYSYTYMADAISGLLTIMLKGKCCEAYNVADETSNITLKELAEIISNYVGRKVIYKAPELVEQTGYSKVTKALLNGNKLKLLGWEPLYTIETGIPRTIEVLKDINSQGVYNK